MQIPVHFLRKTSLTPLFLILRSNSQDPSEPTGPPQPEGLEEPEPETFGDGGIILQIGPGYGEILASPQFYLSAQA